ncbi:MAG: hypothetical protein OHK93_002825 [Ramalina farinacea]|uniref:Wax synthase domain-containing protein n=1 Tax=Ramalina farinacea TaxID=258253 RepID=A0AA43QS42_9LECA|nr:hypothetical protein [Ramalina farinacea]
MLFVHDGRADVKRIEAVATVKQKDKATAEDGAATNSKANDRAYEARTSRSDDPRTENRQISSPASKPSATDEPKPNPTYKWQSLPPTFLHRLHWITELFASLRYPRWSIAIPGLPPPPPEITSQLSLPHNPKPSPHSTTTRLQLLRHNLPKLLFLYLCLDIFKTLTTGDPYFWSLTPAASIPSPLPFPRTTRTFLSAAYAYTALQAITTLAPLFYACLLGPETIGEWAWPWLYSPYFGDLRAVSRNGLAGAWGQWWHQLFRFAFETMGEGAAGALGGEAKGWGKRTKRGGVLRVVVADRDLVV